MADQKLEDFSGKPLTPRENQAARRLLQRDERAQWLLSVVGRIAVWVTAVITATIIAKEYIENIVKGLAK